MIWKDFTIDNNQTSVWKVSSNSPLIWHSWNNEYLVYNRESGATHLLDDATAMLLQSLEKQQQTLSQLIENLAWENSAKEVSVWLEETLQQFKRLGLATVTTYS